jgi:predicted PurR-regulated permease PerM
MFLGNWMYAQNKSSVQNEDEMTKLNKNISSMSAQIKTLQGKVNALSSENNKKIQNFGTDIKNMTEKVDKSAAKTEDLDGKIKENERSDKEKFDNVTKSILKRSNAIFAFCFLIGLFVLIVSYFFNSTLNKNVKLLRDSINNLTENTQKQMEAIKGDIDSRFKKMNQAVEDKLKETDRALNAMNGKISEIKEALEGRISENKVLLDRNLEAFKGQTGSQLNELKESFNNSISKQVNDSKTAFDKQMAVFKNEIYKEISDLKQK